MRNTIAKIANKFLDNVREMFLQVVQLLDRLAEFQILVHPAVGACFRYPIRRSKIQIYILYFTYNDQSLCIEIILDGKKSHNQALTTLERPLPDRIERRKANHGTDHSRKEQPIIELPTEERRILDSHL